jgi:hypothetical protein
MDVFVFEPAPDPSQKVLDGIRPSARLVPPLIIVLRFLRALHSVFIIFQTPDKMNKSKNERVPDAMFASEIENQNERPRAMRSVG